MTFIAASFRSSFFSTLLSLLVFGLCSLHTENVCGGEIPKVGSTFAAKDSLKLDTDTAADAQDCLKGLRWNPGDFKVQCEAAQGDRGDLLIRFPSPMPSGDAINDNVSMEWYVARDENKQPKTARCVVVVHESGRGMTVGRIFARGLQSQGLHTFLIHLPGYGARRTPRADQPEQLLSGMQQAVCDVRRARDAVSSLPLIDSSVVGIQGTSLGGFITATTGGLDDGYGGVFILLAGGNLHDVVLQGKKDAAKVREKLEAIGITGDKIRDLARPVEPLRLAHRLHPESTWLYSGKYDDVVPPECSFALAKAASLPAGHHIEMPADHYSGVIFLPAVIAEIGQKMKTLGDETEK
ncbi:MAG: hypothetical protein JNM43_21895 [Planctomycetaceae bacterium]|nr:hypothetical protein [Planctomycetaceae bacterium]